METKIGFIGQGWIGKNYADYFEDRGFEVIRFALEEPYINNKDKIKECDIVFIAVPTPSTPRNGFEYDIVGKSVQLVGKGKIAVIRSTLVPGTTEIIQKDNPDIIIIHVPEFFTRQWIGKEIPNPDRNIYGIASDTAGHKDAVHRLMDVMPKARYELVCSSREAELIKYARNCMGYTRVIFTNLLFDLAQKLDVDWDKIEQATMADPLQASYYLKPNQKGGRGAGGPCYIKDMVAFRNLYKEKVGEKEGLDVIVSLEEKNKKLLRESGKDLDLLSGVYGDE